MGGIACAAMAATTTSETPEQRRSRRIGAAGLATMGVLHFVAPAQFDRIIPSWVPGKPRTWTHVSGVWELTSAALLARPQTKRLGGMAAAATIVAVYPANIQMALDAGKPHDPESFAAWLRLPFQVPMWIWAYRNATRP